MAILFLFFLFIPLTECANTIETKFGAKYKAYCPKNNFVSRIVINKGKTPKNEYDINFTIDCDPFTRKKESGDEHCVTKFRFAMPDAELMLDNHWKSCTCDEYLSGIKSYLYRGSNGIPTRMVQLRCCYGYNKVMNLSSCYYTGLRYLRAPWNTELRGRSWKWPREVIQSMTISQNYINARVCQWVIKGRDIKAEDAKHWFNKCEGTKKIGIKDIYDKIKAWAEGECIIPTGMSPFGWPESTNSIASENAIVHKKKRLYKNQQTMCRDGNYIYALYKYAIKGRKGKDYVFLTKCHEITYTVCWCFWKKNCTKPEDRNCSKEAEKVGDCTTSNENKTFYIAGWRSKWDKEMIRRELEVLCCESKGLEMKYCNVTKNFTDKDTRLVINRPRYKFDAFMKPEVMDGEILRDIDQWHINGSLILRFNICRVNGSDGACEEKCYDCRDIDPTMSICTIPKTTTASSEPIFDFAFLLDESGSLKQAGFDTEKSFLMEFARQFQISSSQTRVSMLRFSNTATVEWDFNTFPDQTTNTVVNRISGFTYAAGKTDITGSLEKSIPIFQSQARANVNKVVFLLTDGRHNASPTSPSVPAQALRAAGIQIFAVAIGNGIDTGELNDITGDPNKVYQTSMANLVANAAAIRQLIIDNATV